MQKEKGTSEEDKEVAELQSRYSDDCCAGTIYV
jgi:hypothetical protein